jgi:putative transposase
MLSCRERKGFSVIRTYKYRLYPTQAQEKNLLRVLAAARGLYNMVIEARKVAWQQERTTLTGKALDDLAKHYRNTFPYAQQMFSQTAQSVVKQADDAFQAFFRRVKKGQKAGYPRFKTRDRFHSIEFKQFGSGIRVDGRRLKVFGIGRVAVRWHRPMQGTPKLARIKHTAGQWFVCIVCEVPDALPLPETGRALALDAGLSALYTTHEGVKIDHPHYYREAQAELRRKQRKLARAKQGSRNRWKAKRQVQRLHVHVSNQRRDFFHKLSRDAVNHFDLIALEDLRIRNMVRNTRLSKSIMDAGWGIFKELLMSKAGSAGRQVVFVQPAYTSKTCSSCGALFEALTLADRWLECACGLSMDRDHNAAINILNKAIQNGRDAPVNDNAAPLPDPDGSGKRKRRSEAARL